MGAIFTCEHPDQVRKLVLLAPALMLLQFTPFLRLAPVSVPTTILHGRQDTIVPLEEVREIAEKVFSNLRYKIVDDDHRLHQAARFTGLEKNSRIESCKPDRFLRIGGKIYTEKPYWHDTVNMPSGQETNPLPEKVDVAVIGGGYTGLVAALTRRNAAPAWPCSKPEASAGVPARAMAGWF